MQNSLELGAEMTRAGLDAAVQIGNRAAEVYWQCAVLQFESALKAQSGLIEAAGVLLASGNRTVLENLEQFAGAMKENASTAGRARTAHAVHAASRKAA